MTVLLLCLHCNVVTIYLISIQSFLALSIIYLHIYFNLLFVIHTEPI